MRLRNLSNNFQKFEDKKRRIDERVQTEEVSSKQMYLSKTYIYFFETHLKKYFLQANKKRKQKELDNQLKVANKRGERIDTERAPDDILDDIKISEVKLRQGAPLKEDPKKLEEEIKRSKRTLTVDRSTLKTFKLVAEQLRQSQSKRMYFVKSFKGHMVTMLQYTFNVSSCCFLPRVYFLCFHNCLPLILMTTRMC